MHTISLNSLDLRIFKFRLAGLTARALELEEARKALATLAGFPF